MQRKNRTTLCGNLHIHVSKILAVYLHKFLLVLHLVIQYISFVKLHIIIISTSDDNKATRLSKLNFKLHFPGLCTCQWEMQVFICDWGEITNTIWEWREITNTFLLCQCDYSYEIYLRKQCVETVNLLFFLYKSIILCYSL